MEKVDKKYDVKFSWIHVALRKVKKKKNILFMSKKNFFYYFQVKINDHLVHSDHFIPPYLALPYTGKKKFTDNIRQVTTLALLLLKRK